MNTLLSDIDRYRESDSFLAGHRSENPDDAGLNKPFLIRAADCTSAKIHDFALTLWFLVDGDGNLAGTLMDRLQLMIETAIAQAIARAHAEWTPKCPALKRVVLPLFPIGEHLSV